MNPTFNAISTMTSAGSRGYFIVRAGESYEWSTREEDGGSSDYIAQLTLFRAPDTTPVCHDIGNGSSGAFIAWTAPADGAVYIGLNELPCVGNAIPSVVTWRCASCPELTPVLIPDSGSNEVACGNDVRLLDPGGDGYYPNNANGHTVLHASGSAAIRIRGLSVIENNYDALTIFGGTTPSGTPLMTISSTGFVNFQGAPGQSLTARFRSDANIFMAGFDLQVTYSEGCDIVGIEERPPVRPLIAPNPSSGPFTVHLPSGTRTTGIELWDLGGRQLAAWGPPVVNGPNFRVDMDPPLPQGCFVLRLHTTSGPHTMRIVIN
jgi:hypothetical protein